MKASLIRRMASLEKALIVEGYDVTIRRHGVKNTLMFIIKLKDENGKEILETWNSNIGKIGG